MGCVSGCGGSVVVKLPDEIDELDGYDAEKVQERKEVRTCTNFLSTVIQILGMLILIGILYRRETC